MNRLGVALIGQTPRDDLTELLAGPPRTYQLEAKGALDEFRTEDLPLPAAGGYPLTTRLRDGTLVSVDEQFLQPLVQRSIDQLEASGAAAVLLMCAGEFGGLRSSVPLFNPFRLTAELLGTVGCKRVAVLVPHADQVGPSREKWARTGLSPHMTVFEPLITSRLEIPGAADLLLGDGPDAVVVDYVGSPPAVIERLKSTVGVPVFDVGHVAAAALLSTVGRPMRDAVTTDAWAAGS
jgi:protein AroM